MRGGGDFYVIRWEASQGIDEAAFKEEKERVRSSVRDLQHRVIFDSWLENLRGKAEIERLMKL